MFNVQEKIIDVLQGDSSLDDAIDEKVIAGGLTAMLTAYLATIGGKYATDLNLSLFAALVGPPLLGAVTAGAAYLQRSRRVQAFLDFYRASTGGVVEPPEPSEVVEES